MAQRSGTICVKKKGINSIFEMYLQKPGKLWSCSPDKLYEWWGERLGIPASTVNGAFKTHGYILIQATEADHPYKDKWSFVKT
jgi:hypothetical protein